MALDRARQNFVDRMGHTGEADGLSPIAGRLFAALLLSDQPASLDDLAQSLGVSKASVSTEARRLFDRGVVERVTRPGDRRDYYELANDFFASIIRSRVDRWRRFHELTGHMREQSSDLSPAVRARFDSIDEIHAHVVDRVESALDSWEQRDKRRTANNATTKSVYTESLAKTARPTKAAPSKSGRVNGASSRRRRSA